jgi:hypothetical protein
MKKGLLALSIAFLAFSVNTVKAQIVSASADDFEAWTHITPSGFFSATYDDPNAGTGSSGWQTFNILNNSITGSSALSVFKDSTTVHSGKYSCKIMSVALSTQSYGYVKTFIPHDTVGIVVTGKLIVGTSPSFKTGVPFNNRATQMSFWYQYMPATSKLAAPDTAFVSVALSHFSGGKRNVLGGGILKLNAASSWTQGTVTISYDSTAGFPDTITVFYSASSFTHPALGSILLVDGATIVNGVNELYVSPASVTVYPNPATNDVHFNITSSGVTGYINVFDMTGQKVSTIDTHNNFATLNSSQLASGLYFYQLYDKAGSLMKTGKFSISK